MRSWPRAPATGPLTPAAITGAAAETTSGVEAEAIVWKTPLGNWTCTSTCTRSAPAAAGTKRNAAALPVAIAVFAALKTVHTRRFVPAVARLSSSAV